MKNCLAVMGAPEGRYVSSEKRRDFEKRRKDEPELDKLVQEVPEVEGGQFRGCRLTVRGEGSSTEENSITCVSYGLSSRVEPSA